MLAIIEDLGYPHYGITPISNNHLQSTTTFRGANFTTPPPSTSPIQISCGTIQGDTLNPHLIIILEFLLRWLENYHLGYNFNTLLNTITTIAYANDLI